MKCYPPFQALAPFGVFAPCTWYSDRCAWANNWRLKVETFKIMWAMEKNTLTFHWILVFCRGGNNSYAMFFIQKKQSPMHNWVVTWIIPGIYPKQPGGPFFSTPHVSLSNFGSGLRSTQGLSHPTKHLNAGDWEIVRWLRVQIYNVWRMHTIFSWVSGS